MFVQYVFSKTGSVVFDVIYANTVVAIAVFHFGHFLGGIGMRNGDDVLRLTPPRLLPRYPPECNHRRRPDTRDPTPHRVPGSPTRDVLKMVMTRPLLLMLMPFCVGSCARTMYDMPLVSRKFWMALSP